MTLSNIESAQATSLPPEFTLRLGPQSSEHVELMARTLRSLGAKVEISPEGSLVAVRPTD